MILFGDRMPRIAWFSPLPPVRSGIARYSSELLPGLAAHYDIEAFVDGPPASFTAGDARIRLFDAHDFLWKNRARPYDLNVYQLGNAPCHDYMWAYLVRYPGLVVLHDGQLHHARGRMLLQRWQPRRDDYRREFRFNHPDALPDVAELGVSGLLGSLTYLWPMLRAVVESSRHIVVHNDWLAEQIREAHPRAVIDVVDMGVPSTAATPGARNTVRSRHGIADGAVVFLALGKVTPEKRIREALRALASVGDAVPDAHLLVAGDVVEYYDIRAEAEALGSSANVTHAGYLPDEAIDDYLAASDVCLCLRWPTSRETSASWLRCMAAGKPTIFTDLAHTVDVPSLDPRSWSVLTGLKAGTTDTEAKPVGVSIDILDEDHSLKLAIRRLAADSRLRSVLGVNAQALWARRFSLDAMIAAYLRVIARALAGRADGSGFEPLPAHLRSTGAEHAEALVKEISGSEYHLRDAD
jgi:glycosyltransferase involved in cell wall biosynthesis